MALAGAIADLVDWVAGAGTDALPAVRTGPPAAVPERVPVPPDPTHPIGEGRFGVPLPYR